LPDPVARKAKPPGVTSPVAAVTEFRSVVPSLSYRRPVTAPDVPHATSTRYQRLAWYACAAAEEVVARGQEPPV
jgi:hypothetical protein